MIKAIVIIIIALLGLMDYMLVVACAKFEKELERSKTMGCSKWAYEPDKCDGDYCVGECDLCEKADYIVSDPEESETEK